MLNEGNKYTFLYCACENFCDSILLRFRFRNGKKLRFRFRNTGNKPWRVPILYRKRRAVAA